MNINEALKQIIELQHIIGSEIPTTKRKIDDIIPAPKDERFDVFIADYLYNQDINLTIKLHAVENFEILLLSDSKKKNLFDVKTSLFYSWYDDYFKISI